MDFNGFHPKVRYTSVPNPMFSTLLEKINDLVELKCTLRIIWLLQEKRGHPKKLTFKEIVSDQILSKSVSRDGIDSRKEIMRGLNLAVNHGVFCRSLVDSEGSEQQHVYTLNTVSDRRNLYDTPKDEQNSNDATEQRTWNASNVRPNIFGLYEDNIGMLSPMITEELKEAEEMYPHGWIEDAFREAVGHNKRSWRYVAAILQRWQQEGRDDGKPIRGTKKSRYY